MELEAVPCSTQNRDSEESICLLAAVLQLHQFKRHPFDIPLCCGNPLPPLRGRVTEIRVDLLGGPDPYIALHFPSSEARIGLLK